MHKSPIIAAVLLMTASLAGAQRPGTNAGSNPSPSNGKDMYVAYCASCHGTDGKGNGPAAQALKTAPSDLTTLAKSHDGKFPYDVVIQAIKGDTSVPAHGSKEMPVWGPALYRMSSHSDIQVQQRLRNLARYLETLQAN